LRALVSTWHHKASREISEPTVRSLVERLASILPEYRLPAVTLGHTRHYMPFYDPEKTGKVFDTFAAVRPGDEVAVVWQGLELPAAEASALAKLAELLGYLGRAESWVEASPLEAAVTVNCQALGTDGVAADTEAVRLLAPQSPEGYSRWVKASGFTTNGHTKKKGTTVPGDLWSALHVETADLRSAGWSDPPGSRWVMYGRPRALYDVRSGGQRKPPTHCFTVARYAVASSVPPLFINGISVAEKVHKSLVDQACKLLGDGNAPPVFTGRDESGKPLSGHQHLHILWEANDPRRPGMTHLTLYAPMGFTHDDRRVLERLRVLYAAKGHDVHLVLLGTGEPADFAGSKLQAGQCPLFETSRVWVSRTPFVPTRHPKRYHDGRAKLDGRGLEIGGPEHDLRRLLAERGLPEPVSVTPLDETEVGGHGVRFYRFRTTRYEGEGRRGSQSGYGFRVEFPCDVTGPVAVGFGVHFGLGVLAPEVP
jgi:CRISPR-associated protein Csb2